MIRKHRIALLAAATFNLVFFFPLLFMGRVVSPNDIYFNYDPWAAVRQVSVQNSLLNDASTSYLTELTLLRAGGKYFHWDPFVACGVPGTGWAFDSPIIAIPGLLLPLPFFYSGLIFLKLNVAFLFAYLWLREEQLGKRAAAVGAIIYAGSGILAVRWLWHATNATTLYPMLLWLTRRAFRGKKTSVAVMALLALMYALSGFPSTMAYGAYITLAYALFLIYRDRKFPGAAIAAGAVAVVLALVIALPTLVAFVHFLGSTGYLVTREKVSLNVFFPISHLMSFIRPDRLGNPVYKNWIGDPTLGLFNNYYESTIYVGIAAIPLAFVALFNRRARTRLFWAAAAAVIICATFNLALVPQVLGRLPGFRYTPLPRTVSMLPLCAAYLAAAGTALLTRWKLRQWIAAIIAVLAAFDLGLFAGRFHPYLTPAESVIPTTPTLSLLAREPRPFRIAPFFLYLWPNASEMYELEDLRSHFSSESRYRALMERLDPSSWSGTSTVIQFDSRTFRFDDPLLGMLGVRYLIENRPIDIVKWSVFAATEPGVKETGATILKPGGTFERTVRVDAQPFYAIEVPIAVEEANGRDPHLEVVLAKDGRTVWARSFTPAEIAVMEKVYIPLWPYARSGESVSLRLRSFGIRGRTLTGPPVAGETPFFYGRVKTPIIFDRELPDGRLFRNVAEMPRFHVARRVIKLTPSEFLARRDVDVRETAVITSRDPLPNAGDGTGATVHLDRYEADRQIVSTSSPAPFFMASSEKLTPELQVTLDGTVVRPIEIATLFAGVTVPAGTHRIVFSRRIGRGWWWPSGIAAFLVIAIGAFEAAEAVRKKKRSRPAVQTEEALPL